MKSWRRIMLVVAVAGVWAGAGSALFASSAMAGGFDNWGDYLAAVYNFTPYPWTLVAQNASSSGGVLVAPGHGTDCPTAPSAGEPTPLPGSCWTTAPAQTIAPYGATLYGLQPNSEIGQFLGDRQGYDGWMTYRVDVLGGPPEYVTIALSQALCGGAAGNCIPDLRQFITSAPPPATYDPGPNPDAAPAPAATPSQLTYQPFSPYAWDITYSLTGNWTVDARSNQGQTLAGVLNALCAGAANTSCSFTQTSPLTWGIGTPTKAAIAANCTVSKTGQGQSVASPVGDQPPPLDPDWVEVSYTTQQTTALTVGGSVSASVEAGIKEVVSVEVTAEVEAEHEWAETKEYERSTTAYIPSNDISQLYVAPTVGTVTGTLTLTSGAGTINLTNFSETVSGVARDPLTPAFDAIVKTRPMTAAEIKDLCPATSSGSKGLGAPPPSGALAKVKRGQTRERVMSELGAPALQRFRVITCAPGNTSCEALGGRGGTWVYPGVLIAFGPNGRVTAIIRTAPRRTKGGRP